MNLNTAIVGIGQTEFSKDSGRSELQLACECILSALNDAGLSPADVDGMSTFTIDNNEDVDLVRSLGIENLRFSSRVPHGGGGSTGILTHAAAAISSGLADVVVVWRAMNERSGRRFGRAQTGGGGSSPGVGTGFASWCVPYGALTPANWAAMSLQRYMDEYGVTNEDCGKLAVILREYASTNPAAWYYGRPLTLEEHQASKWVIEPTLRLYDCCQETDGGVAIVLTSEDRAKDLRQKPVKVAATAQAVPQGTEVITNFYHSDLTKFREAEFLGEELYKRTGLSANDIDVAMLYDHFSPIIFMQLEAYGFCGYGEAADFVKDGNIGLKGAIPVNTHGGLIGEAYVHGVNNITEAVRQIRGTAANQASSVDTALVSAGMSGAILTSL